MYLLIHAWIAYLPLAKMRFSVIVSNLSSPKKTEICLQIKLELRLQSKVYINSDSRKQKKLLNIKSKTKGNEKKQKFMVGMG